MTTTGPAYPAVGSIERYSAKLNALIDVAAPIEQLADGFRWAEGPIWDMRRGRLLFSDIPNNRIHSWADTEGLKIFLDPAGDPHGDTNEHAAAGTNGLFYETASDSLLICNQDGRSIDRLELSSNARSKLSGLFEAKKFNSPNDVIRASDGTIYFTDPPYGLKDGEASAGRELDFQGVYSLSRSGEVRALIRDMTLPNGLALSPDERYLYVSQSDPDAPILRRFTLESDGSLSGGGIWLDTAPYSGEGHPGLPDGMALDREGIVFTTGPGGVFITAPNGEVLGRIHTGKATANCAFGEDGSTLFMTATDTLLRVRTKTVGLFFA